jgi:hypothetical protein
MGASGARTLERTRAVASRKKKGYKVMMEVVEQEKKKLRSVVSNAHPSQNPEWTDIEIANVHSRCASRLHVCTSWLSYRSHRVLQREV